MIFDWTNSFLAFVCDAALWLVQFLYLILIIFSNAILTGDWSFQYAWPRNSLFCCHFRLKVFFWYFKKSFVFLWKQTTNALLGILSSTRYFAAAHVGLWISMISSIRRLHTHRHTHTSPQCDIRESSGECLRTALPWCCWPCRSLKPRFLRRFFRSLPTHSLS